MYYLLGTMATNVTCRPSFIAFNHLNGKSLALRLARALFKVPTFAWTVRSKEESEKARENGFDALIFENYLE